MAILMISSKQRKIINTLINKNDFYSGNDLCTVAELSPKTLRLRIREIDDLLQDHGARIKSKTGVGYFLEVFDRKKYDTFLKEFDADSRRNRYLDYPTTWRIHFIIRKLLISNTPINLFTFEDNFFISRTALNKELQSVKDKLNDFSIKVKNKKPYGVYLEGSEWSLRLCMLYEHKVFMRLSEEERDNEKDFDYFFKIDSSSYTSIEKIIQRNLGDFSIPRVYIHKVIYYIILSIRRSTFSDNIELDEETSQIGKNSKLYPVSDYVLNDLTTELGFAFNEMDKVALALLMGSYVSLNKDYWDEDVYLSFKDNCLSVINSVFDRIQLTEVKDSILIEQITCLIISASFRSRSNIILDEETLHHLDYDDILIHDLANLTVKLLEDFFSFSITKYERKTIFYIYYLSLMRNIQNITKRLNVIIWSHAGDLNALHIYELINKKYYSSIKTIEKTSSVVMLLENIASTDVIITDFESSIFKTVNKPILLVDLNSDYIYSKCDEYFESQQKKSLEYINRFNSQYYEKKQIFENEIDSYIISIMSKKLKLKATSKNINQKIAGVYTKKQNTLLIQIINDEPVIYSIRFSFPISWKGEVIEFLIFYSYGSLDSINLLDFQRQLKKGINTPLL